MSNPMTYDRSADIAQDAAKFEQLIEALHHVQTGDPVLGENARYTLQPRKGYTAARQKRLDEYSGPDEHTEALLEVKGSDWFTNPRKFFDTKGATGVGGAPCHPLISFVVDFDNIDRDIA
ncbi:hypothetical protein CAC42_5461 [Sphaceloma murrayae]|uniref:Uncharacterized protein n=1 Tax=Sphaceloma murrayae TaxID=2082308 RepID=A0A2K1QK83_9PEZI|nr:hypothetical protein CAC42_5461 [Sphaceloma murrayae]